MGGLLTFLVLLAIGFFAGRANETAHFARLKKDEAALAHIDAVSIKTIPAGFEPDGALVSGNVVVAVDYFKKIYAALIMIFGGRLGMYETLLDRARREALVRMKREAAEMGADAVYNIRLEFSAVGQQPNAIGGAELLAYGTAVKRLP